MSAQADEWDQRVKEVGPGIKARRIFSDLGNYGAGIALAEAMVAEGIWPIMSFKVPNNDWAGLAAGKYDKQLKALHDALVTVIGGPGGPHRVFATAHHEPIGDGTAKDWSAMLTHALPILKGGENSIRVGPIFNGYVWSNRSQGMTDQEIAAWLPQSLLDVTDIVAADCYQSGTAAKPGEDAGVKIKNMIAWAGRVGVTRIGIGEFSGLSADTIKVAVEAAQSSPIVRFACIYNSHQNLTDRADWVLSGDRLTAFKGFLT